MNHTVFFLYGYFPKKKNHHKEDLPVYGSMLTTESAFWFKSEHHFVGETFEHKDKDLMS